MVATRRSNNKRKQKEENNEVASGSKKTQNNKRAKIDTKQDLIEESNIIKKDKGKTKMTFEKEKHENQDSLIKKNEEEEEESDEENIDWETVYIPLRYEEEPSNDIADDQSIYNDVEIVMDTPRPVLKKSNWERVYQRNLREQLHHSHVILLIAHYKFRNKWCSDKNMKSACVTVLPDHVKRMLSKENTFENALIKGIKTLLKWWREFFSITGPGLLTIPYNDFIENYSGYTSIESWITNSQQSNENGDYIPDLSAFIDLLVSKSATRDTSAELFVALLRSCDCDARLVSSIQPVPYKIPPEVTTKETTQEEEEGAESKRKPLFEYRTTSRSYVSPDIQLKASNAKPPTVWAEVYATDTKRWICVDPIRGLIDKPTMMEPANLNRTNFLSYVLAFDKKGNITDVTRRYTSNMEKAIRLRERPLTKREIESGIRLWSDILLETICYRSKLSQRDLIEQQELEKQQVKEVMPTSLSGFKNHPLYALERHLLKFEVIYPKEPIMGSIRGEKIYPRKNVKTVCTADTFKKLGRQIKIGEQPIKMVKSNPFTIEKKRMKEMAKQDGQEYLVSCYGDWQTEPYIPPPVVDGVLPKNSFGNIELFTPSMLPAGAAHIPIKGIAKIAKKCDIDYANAVVDFEFVKMKSIPVINGIIVAEQSKNILLEAWEEYEQNESLKAIEKQQKDIYIRWRKLIKGLLIKTRIEKEYGTEEKENIESKWNRFNQNTTASNIPNEGGFLLDENDDTHAEDKWDKFNSSKLNNTSDFGGGGFLEDENDDMI